MSKSEASVLQPKSIRQKRILDIAAKNPNATVDEIADRVPSATVDHVNRVFDQYGDPAAGNTGKTDVTPVEQSNRSSANDEHANAGSQDGERLTTEQPSESSSVSESNDEDTMEHIEEDGNTSGADRPAGTETTSTIVGETQSPHEETIESDDAESAADISTPPSPDDLTQKERETLRAICYEPTATQKQIADMLDVSRATVSNRVNAIPGFDWAARQAFVDEVFDGELVIHSESTATSTEKRLQTDRTERLANGEIKRMSEERPSDSNPETPPDAADEPTESAASDANITSSAAAENTGHGSEEPIVEEIETIAVRLDTIEKKLETIEPAASHSPFDDAEMMHKIITACMHSERVSEDEELELLKTLLD